MYALEDHYWWYVGLHRLVLQNLPHPLPPRPTPKILDAGCGTGRMLQLLQQTRPQGEFWGIDLEATAVELTQQRCDAQVAIASVTDLPFPDQTFDGVISLDVISSRGVAIEEALQEFARVLKPRGWLILNLPALESLRGQHDLAVHTERRYTRPQIEQLLRAAGFNTQVLTYWNLTLLPVVAIVRFCSRHFPVSRAAAMAPRSDLKPLPTLLNRCLTRLILWEVQLTRRWSLPIGSSVFAVGSLGPGSCQPKQPIDQDRTQYRPPKGPMV